jgi:ATP-binding cassette subfamily B protein
MKATIHRNVGWRIWEQIRPYSRHLAGLFSLSLLAPPLALLTPLPLKIAVDSVLGHQPLPRFLQIVLPEAARNSPGTLLMIAVSLVLVAAVLSQLRDFASNLLSTYTGEKLLRGFRAQIFAHLQRLSLSYHDTKGIADSVYRIQYDAASLQRIAVESIVPSVTSALTLVAMLYVTIRINWQLALVAVAISPLLFLVSRRLRRHLRGQSHHAKRLESSVMAIVQQALGAARVVKAFGQENRESQRFIEESNKSMQAKMRLIMMQRSYGMVVALLTASGMAAVLFIGVRDIQAGTLTLGNFLLIMGYLAQLYNPLKTLGKKMTTMQNNLAGAERAFALLDEAPDVVDRSNAQPLVRAAGELTFCNVSFAYPERVAPVGVTAPSVQPANLRPVLEDISFRVEPGSCVGVVGTTGAGKTTLASLLMRFYDPTAGSIRLDGVDLRDYKLTDLRNQFALVLQESILFSTTIRENIAYARPDAAESEIIAAAKSANAHQFIVRLPKGYDTPVGDRGLCLSGGERQRIALARAFLKDAPILILDEPTSSVDVKTEAAIVEAMERLMKGRTTLIIAHRLSTLAHCDLILKVELGRLVEVQSVATREDEVGLNVLAVEAR